MNRRRFLRGVAAAATPVAAVQALSLAARDSAIEGEKGQRDARGITESKRRIFRATAAAMSNPQRRSAARLSRNACNEVCLRTAPNWRNRGPLF